MRATDVIIGGGMTGLAASLASGAQVFETSELPGGICSSYYLSPGQQQRLSFPATGQTSYRFELGGGHWIFGGDPAVLSLIKSLVSVRSYARRSRVYFSREGRYVPYPIQNHLASFPNGLALQALTEMAGRPDGNARTMADWLYQNFGGTLTELFFGPFHELYTAGLWREIAPQDAYKSPVDYSLVLRGAFTETTAVGYNATFVYPVEGLNTLAACLAERCQIAYGKTVTAIDTKRKEVHFGDGTGVAYEHLITTLPLNRMLELSGLEVESKCDPYTSVLVLNIGAMKAGQCPDDHWLYVPDSTAGFHRVGLYSAVDPSFILGPDRNSRVGLYVERAYRGADRPTEEQIKAYTDDVVRELQAWDFIGEVEVADPTWVDVAYTWSWPDSKWRRDALRILEQTEIHPVGRYGRWVFQGIADSIRDGLFVGAAINSRNRGTPPKTS